MDRESTKAQLRALLLHDVAYLCRRKDVRWSTPIVRTLHDIRSANLPAVFFGGVLRSLLLSRLEHGRLGRPRDVDIVVAGASVGSLRETFHGLVERETRFGGLHLQRENWQFDVWPVDQTWAFQRENRLEREFSALPATTFFNLEAIAVDVWPLPGHPRRIYSGDDQFFDGVLSRTLEINKEENPFPALCVVRAIVMASATGFAVGPRLAEYLSFHHRRVSDQDLEHVQLRHYSQIRQSVTMMRAALERIAEAHRLDPHARIEVFSARQMTLWPEDEPGWPRVTLHVLTKTKSRDEHEPDRRFAADARLGARRQSPNRDRH